MSYQMFRQKCLDCEECWNAAFGIVGTSIIAQPPTECPKCKSKRISKFADGWEMSDGSTFGDGGALQPGAISYSVYDGG
jgi:hypothetical protein